MTSRAVPVRAADSSTKLRTCTSTEGSADARASVDGFIGESFAIVEGTAEGQFCAQRGEQERAVGVVGSDPVERHFQQRNFVGVNRAGLRVIAPMICEYRLEHAVRVAELCCPSRSIEEGLA